MRFSSRPDGHAFGPSVVRRALTRATAGCCAVIVLTACGDGSDAEDEGAGETSPTTSTSTSNETFAPIASEVSTSAGATTIVAPQSPTSLVPEVSPASAPPIGDGAQGVAQPTPDQMCAPGSVPQAAAYDFDDGTFLWVACSAEPVWRTVRAVTDDAVYVATASQDVTALDPATGDVLDDAPPPPPMEDHGYPPVIEVDGVRIRGEQMSRVWATDMNDVELWSRPGGWVYGDVWAIDDGAVFAVEQGQTLVAYDIRTGDIRWQHRGDPYAEGLWPWHAEDQRLYSLWGNLQVRSTVDGALIWATQYPWSGMPTESLHMSGVGTDGDRVVVAFAAAGSGGD
jgi:hypothetical protein